jgi:hypothetical protein
VTRAESCSNRAELASPRGVRCGTIPPSSPTGPGAVGLEPEPHAQPKPTSTTRAKRPFLVPIQIEQECRVSTEPPAKFFVNRGIVSSRTDIHHLLRPLLKQTVTYRYFRGRDLVDHGTGWVERIVADDPDVSTYFTPLSICLNIDSFEHLEFETRIDQLIVYALVQGDERVVLEFAPVADRGEEGPLAPRQLEFDTSGFVQMELLGLQADEGAGGRGAGS